MNAALLERSNASKNPSPADAADGAEPDLVMMPSNGDGRAAEAAPAGKSRRKTMFWTILIVAAVGAAGAWVLFPQWFAAIGLSDGKSHEKASLEFVPVEMPASDAPGNGQTLAPPSRTTTVLAETEPRCDVLRLTGSLMADERSSVASNTSGIVAQVLVDRGDLVRKDQVLVQIDKTDAENKLAEGQSMFNELKARLGLEGDLSAFNPEEQPEVRLAKASADLAASNLRRDTELVEKKVISTEAFDKTKTEHELAVQRYRQSLLLIRQAFRACETAQAKLAILKKALADTSIRAPFDGWVAEKLVAVGEQINSGAQATKVVTLVRIDPLRLSLTVPQQDVGRIEPGQLVRFEVDSFPDRDFEAKVRFIAPVVNDTRSMVVEAVVPNGDCELRPGIFATAKLQLPRRQATVMVPSSAVLRIGETGRVFVVRDGRARAQVVALGCEEKGKVEILKGLNGGERLVADPSKVNDGDKVNP